MRQRSAPTKGTAGASSSKAPAAAAEEEEEKAAAAAAAEEEEEAVGIHKRQQKEGGRGDSHAAGKGKGVAGSKRRRHVVASDGEDGEPSPIIVKPNTLPPRKKGQRTKY